MTPMTTTREEFDACIADAVGRAVAAERERCALIANRVKFWAGKFDAAMTERIRAAEWIEHAIREGK